MVRANRVFAGLKFLDAVHPSQAFDIGARRKRPLLPEADLHLVQAIVDDFHIQADKLDPMRSISLSARGMWS